MSIVCEKPQELICEINQGDVICSESDKVTVVKSFIADMTTFDMITPLINRVGKYQMHIGKSVRNVTIVNMWDFKGGKKGKQLRRVKENGKRI